MPISVAGDPVDDNAVRHRLSTMWPMSELAVRLAPASIWQRSAPVAVGVGLAAAGLYVAANDPAAAGSRFPACVFHRATGLWCPGCGLTRGTHQLLNGDVAAALSYNVFTPIVLAAIAVTWVVWLRTAWGRPTRTLVERLPAWWGGALAVAMVVFGVARNLPVAGMRALAP
jgi:hypothetical protein